MTLSEAVELILQASAMPGRGKIYFLDMGEPVAILQLARKMIHLSGVKSFLGNHKADTPSDAIRIEFTGLRPGEKLHEELTIGKDTFDTRHPKIFYSDEMSMEKGKLDTLLQALAEACKERDAVKLRRLLECPEIRLTSSSMNENC